MFYCVNNPIQWTNAIPVGADRPAKRQKKMSWSLVLVHSPDGVLYFLPV